MGRRCGRRRAADCCRQRRDRGGSAIAWLDLNGQKLSGRMWLGGVWTGASQLPGSAGPMALPGVYAYAGTIFQSRLRLSALCNPARTRFNLGAFPGGPRRGPPRARFLSRAFAAGGPERRRRTHRPGGVQRHLCGKRAGLEPIVPHRCIRSARAWVCRRRRPPRCRVRQHGEASCRLGRRVLATDGSRGATGRASERFIRSSRRACRILGGFLSMRNPGYS